MEVLFGISYADWEIAEQILMTESGKLLNRGARTEFPIRRLLVQS